MKGKSEKASLRECSAVDFEMMRENALIRDFLVVQYLSLYTQCRGARFKPWSGN